LKNGLLLLLIFMAGKSYASDFIPAMLIENGNPSHIETSQSTRTEWWAYVTFVIDKSGATSDVEFINISRKAKDSARDKVNQYIKRLQYSPAIQNGKPVQSSKNMFYVNDISFYGSANDGVSVGFKNNYNDADKLILAGKLTEAKQALTSLEEDYQKNLKEQALTAWLKSVYYYKASAWGEYGEEVEKAFLLKAYLPKKMVIKTINNLTEFRIFKQQYNLALESAAEFKTLEGISNGNEAYLAYHDRILANLAEHTDVESAHVMKEGVASYILLDKGDVTFTMNSGSVEKVQVRCLNRVRTLAIKAEMKFSIADDEKKCALLVKGKSGSELSLLEQGRIILK